MGQNTVILLKPWVDEWATEDLFAGVGHAGAEDAWWQTSNLLEESILNNIQLTGGAADIWKCFDQVLRPLLFHMLEQGGMPPRIART